MRWLVIACPDLTNHHTVSIASLTIVNSRGKVLLKVVPNVYPATRIIARKDYGDESLVEYIQVWLCLKNVLDDLTGFSALLGPGILPNLTFALVFVPAQQR